MVLSLEFGTAMMIGAFIINLFDHWILENETFQGSKNDSDSIRDLKNSMSQETEST